MRYNVFRPEPAGNNYNGLFKKRSEEQQEVSNIVSRVIHPNETNVEKRGTLSRRGLDPFLGEIVLFSFQFAPRGWAL